MPLVVSPSVDSRTLAGFWTNTLALEVSEVPTSSRFLTLRCPYPPPSSLHRRCRLPWSLLIPRLLSIDFHRILCMHEGPGALADFMGIFTPKKLPRLSDARIPPGMWSRPFCFTSEGGGLTRDPLPCTNPSSAVARSCDLRLDLVKATLAESEQEIDRRGIEVMVRWKWVESVRLWIVRKLRGFDASWGSGQDCEFDPRQFVD